MRGGACPPVFVVGTGRCGSTLLSRFLRRHPAILSLSELFVFATDLGRRITGTFPDQPIDGAGLWRILGAAHPMQTLMLRQDVMMEEALYRPALGRRFGKAEGIPAIAATALPHLSDDPDALYDRIAGIVRGFGAGAAGELYSALFDRLREDAGARLWVERSGGSLRLVRRLRQHFPDARFVHIIRDGRDTAISMSRHAGFRMALLHAQLTEILGVDPYESADRTWAGDLPDDLECYLPERFDAERFRSERAALPLCGYYWSGEIAAGLRELADLPPDRLLTLQYEDLLAAPEPVLERFFRFLLQGDEPGDLSRFASEVKPPRSDWRSLPERESAALDRACQAGTEAVADHLNREAA